MLRYQADEARTGSRQTLAVDGDRRLEGAIPDVIDASLALVDSWAPRRRAMRDDGRFGPVDVIPREAWTEAVVNAVVHRSWWLATAVPVGILERHGGPSGAERRPPPSITDNPLTTTVNF